MYRTHAHQQGRAWLDVAVGLMPYDTSLLAKEREKYDNHYQ